MNFKEYQQAALRTAVSDQSENFRVATLALGLCGELQELEDSLSTATKEETLLEVGDVLWYVATLADALGLNSPEFIHHTEAVWFWPQSDSHDGDPLWYAEDAKVSACRVAEQVKKHVAHGKLMDKKVVSIRLLSILENLAMLTDLSLAAIENVEKLKRRYPDGFKEAVH